MSSRVPGWEYGLLAVAVVGISASGPLAAAIALPALTIAFWRNAMAAVVLGGQRLATRRTAGAPSRRDLAVSSLAGVFLAAHFALWIPSLSMTSVAASTALVCTTPLWSVLLLAVTGTRVNARTWAGSAIALAGVVVISGVDVSGDPRALWGDLMALGGGACMAGYLAVGERVQRRVDTVSYTLTCYSVAGLVLLAGCLVRGDDLVSADPVAWLLLAALTVCGQLAGHSLLNRALRWLPGTTVATLVLLEVPGAALLAAAFLGQLPDVTVWVGIVVIVAGLWVTVQGQRSRIAR